MATRYDGLGKTTTAIQNSETMKEVLESRGLTQVTHYNTKIFKSLTSQQIQSLTSDTYIWKSNDKYWKLSAKYYGDPKYWWIIAWYNKKPIESMNNVGDQILIPFPLDKILGMF